MPRVYFTELDVMDFNHTWPGSHIEETAGYFEFDSRGNLVDCSDNVRGTGFEYAAFSQDMQTKIPENWGI
jgi:hypothetical protein